MGYSATNYSTGASTVIYIDIYKYFTLLYFKLAEYRYIDPSNNES